METVFNSIISYDKKQFFKFFINISQMWMCYAWITVFPIASALQRHYSTFGVNKNIQSNKRKTTKKRHSVTPQSIRALFSSTHTHTHTLLDTYVHTLISVLSYKICSDKNRQHSTLLLCCCCRLFVLIFVLLLVYLLVIKSACFFFAVLVVLLCMWLTAATSTLVHILTHSP